MKIKIKYKEFPRNLPNRANHLTFAVDDKEFTIPIIYIKTLRINAFLEDASLKEFEEYIHKNYDCTWKEFGDYFLNYCLYNYSRGIGIDKREYKDISSLQRKEEIKKYENN